MLDQGPRRNGRVLLLWRVTRSEMLFLKRLNTLGIVRQYEVFSVRSALGATGSSEK